ncbi:MAG: hypothetical protein Q9169_004619 [Polycauliona sp. 2 TL-2023]
MQRRPFSPNSQSRTVPISKYYYGPAPTNGDAPPALPPRQPPGAASSFPASEEPTAPPAHPVARSSYNPNNHAPLPAARHSPINPTWNQSSTSVAQGDTSTWGVNYHHNNISQLSQHALKPPLPVSQSSIPSPSLPQGFSPSVQYQPQQASWQSEPQRLPPPPPPKIHGHDEKLQEGIPKFRSEEFNDPPQTDTLSSFEGRPGDNGADRSRRYPDDSIKASTQDYAGDAFISPQTTGDQLGDNHYVSAYPHRLVTAGSGWSVQSGTVSPRSAPTASDTGTVVASPSLQRQDPSRSFVHQVHDRSTLPTHQQDSRSTHNTPTEKKGKDLYHDEASSHNVNTPMDSRGRGSRVRVVASGQEIVPPRVSSSQRNVPSNNSDQSPRDDSFYWHSPQTSASTSHDRDQNRDVPGTSSLLDATPEPQEQHVVAPPPEANSISTSGRAPSPIMSIFGSYSASALGFGGPSDWEHFGDYSGEEVDDTALYLRPRSPVKQAFPSDTPELPADPAPVVLQIQEPPQVRKASSTVVPAAEPNALESLLSDEPQAERVAKQDIEHQSMEVNPILAENVEASEQSGLMKPHQSDSLPSSERPLDQVRNSAPKLPKLDFEHDQRVPESNPDLHTEPDLAKEHTLEQNTTDSFQPQASHLPALHDHLSSVSVNSGLPMEPATIGDDTSVGTGPPPFDDQTYMRLGSPLGQNVATTQADYQDQSRQDHVKPPSDTQDSPGKDSTNQASLVESGSVPSEAQELSGPYANLDPWAKSSLNRYVAMLHEEAQASTGSEKLNLFKAFSRKEWRLRAVLYGADDERGDDLLTAPIDGPIQRANTLDLRRPASKALPALPPDADRPMYEVDHEQHPPNSVESPASTATRPITPVEKETPIRFSRDNSRTVLDTVSGRTEQHAEQEIAESYSPGGRPIQGQASDPRKSLARSLPDTSNRSGMRHTTASNATKTSYTPFRYSQGYVDNSDQPVDRRASFRPYAALKLEPVKDHAETTPEPISDLPRPTSLPLNPHLDPNDGQQEETSSLNEQTTDPKQRSSEMSRAWSLPKDQDQPLDLRRFEKADFDPLVAVLPLSGYIPRDALELVSFQRSMNAVPDDFGFIHQNVVAWDTKAKKVRGELEKERQSRQTESEQRIDALFNDDEIGYGDISELEEEYKRAEATRKTNEDRAEYSTFVEEVFNVVWTRLHFEIDQLTPMYDEYTNLAHATLAGKEMFAAREGQYALAPTMSTLLTIHQRLEIRHQKAFEAVLERDRRLKKTEVGPWYTLGNVTKVKQMEKQFDRAEKKAIVEYCKQRDARANRLMDVLDQNTLRGVGANQDYMEAVMKAVRRIASGRAFASAPANEPGMGMEEVIKAKTVTAVLASSSEQIVQTFHVADMLLNAADYELSVATARLANADSTTLERLKDERAAEDAKLMRDLQHRLTLIREDSRRTNDEIVKLLCFLGVEGGHAQVGKLPNISVPVDAEHEQRLQKALEDAKRRNAQKAAAPEGTS